MLLQDDLLVNFVEPFIYKTLRLLETSCMFVVMCCHVTLSETRARQIACVCEFKYIFLLKFQTKDGNFLGSIFKLFTFSTQWQPQQDCRT